METNKGLTKLIAEVKRDDTWLKEATWRQENEAWLERSAQIAFQVLETLSEQKRTQKDLAEAMGVSPQFVNKIVKGSENLTLETISKLENALNVQLMEILEYTSYQYRPESATFLYATFPQQSIPIRPVVELVKESECNQYPLQNLVA